MNADVDGGDELHDLPDLLRYLLVDGLALLAIQDSEGKQRDYGVM